MQIHNYLKSSLIDYPGKIACVVFTQGCPWRCWYCQNAELLPTTKGIVDEQEVLEFLETRKGLVDGVVVCGGEPTIQPDLEQFISKVKQLGFPVKLDTNGTNPDVMKNLLDKNLIDYVAMDFKAPLSKYDEVASVPVDVDAIKKSIKILIESNIDYEFRTTAIPTLNKEDFLEIAKSVAGAKLFYIQHYVKQKSYNKSFKLHSTQELEEIAKLCNDVVKTKLR